MVPMVLRSWISGQARLNESMPTVFFFLECLYRRTHWFKLEMQNMQLIFLLLSQSRSQGDAGMRRTTPNLPKGPLLVTKWAKNGVFVGGVKGVRFKKSTLGVWKVHFCGVPHRPKIDPGYVKLVAFPCRLWVCYFMNKMKAYRIAKNQNMQK